MHQSNENIESLIYHTLLQHKLSKGFDYGEYKGIMYLRARVLIRDAFISNGLSLITDSLDFDLFAKRRLAELEISGLVERHESDPLVGPYKSSPTVYYNPLTAVEIVDRKTKKV